MNEIKEIIAENKNKRIIVVGTTCAGKSTIFKSIPQAQDMDELIFPKLTKAETKFVCQVPWTKEIGQTMNRLVKEKIKVKKGNPVFGTVILDCDLIIYLDISDKLLKERTKKRKVNFKDAKNMKMQLIEEIKESKIPVVKIKIE